MTGTTQSSIPLTADVVIVGAGMAGLFCAWRLLTASASYKNKTIVILDKGLKAGGVLQSDVVQIDGTTVVGEEGAMRFDKNSMCNIVKLAGDLGLKIVDFAQNDPGASLYYLRGKTPFTESQGNSSTYWLDRYNIPPTGFNNPTNIINNAISLLVSVNANIALPSGNSSPTTLADWAVFRNDYTFGGFELNQWGFMPLLTSMGYGHESIKMLEDAFGFIGLYQKRSNAGNTLFALGHYAKATPQFSTIDGGLEQLAAGIYQLSQAHYNATFGFDTAVQSFDYAPPDASEFTVQYTVGGAHEGTITCSDLILALPRFALEQLSQVSPPLQGARQGVRISNLLASVDNMILTKINLFYDNCWWFGATGNIGKPLVEGACFSDLPLEQIYFFPSDATDLNKPGSLTIYSSYHHTNYWEPLQQAGTPFTPVPPLSQPT
ncbi:MAG: FAD-dependent oxidoreductase, partial [Sneathiella sp.]